MNTKQLNHLPRFTVHSAQGRINTALKLASTLLPKLHELSRDQYNSVEKVNKIPLHGTR